MKYKNIVFDFGNVIGKFNGRDLVKHFSSCEEDQELLFTAIFSRWDDIDNGSVDYEQNIDNIAASLPDRDVYKRQSRDSPHRAFCCSDNRRKDHHGKDQRSRKNTVSVTCVFYKSCIF